jgi:hypothetical protein
VSLNLEKRRAERTAMSPGELAHGSVSGAPPAGDEAGEDPEAIEERPDAILGEAAQIAADLAQLEPRYLAGAKAGS